MRIPLLGVHLLTDTQLDGLLSCAGELADIEWGRRTAPVRTENIRLAGLVAGLREALRDADQVISRACSMCGADLVLAAIRAIEQERPT